MRNIFIASLYFLLSLALSFFVFHYLRSPYVPMIMLLPVFIITSLFGSRYGYASAFVSAISIYFFFCEPVNSFIPKDSSSFVRITTYLILAAASIVFIAKKRAVDDAIAQSERHFRELADAAPVLIWMSGTDKLCYYFNNTWLEFTGRTMEEEAGDGWAQGVHPDDLQKCITIYVSSFDARKSFSMEYRLRHKDGSYRWLLDTGTPRFDEDGQFLGYIGSCTDITQIKEFAKRIELEQEAKQKTEELLRLATDSEDEMQALNEELEATNEELSAGFAAIEAERDKVQMIVDELPSIIIIKDKDLRYSFMNKALCTFLNKTESQLLGKTVFDFLSKEEAEKIWENEKKILENNETLVVEETIVDAQGKTRTLLSAKKQISTEDGETGLLIVITDISERKAMESELKNSEDKFRTIFESSYDAIMLLDETGFIDCNQRTLDLFGIADKSEFISLHPAAISSPIQADGEDAKSAAAKQIEIAIQKGSNHFDWSSMRKNGDIFPTDVLLSSLSYQGKTIIQCTVRDLTNIKAAQARIDEQERTIFAQSRFAAMGEMIGMIAHQWRQPITAIGMGANNMIMDIELGESDMQIFKKHLEQINNQVQFLSTTIDDFRNFFKPNRDMTETSVGNIVDGSLKIIGKSLENNNVKVEKKIEFNPPIEAYESELIQVFLAIIGNAKDALLEHSVESPTITIISLQNPEFMDFVELHICDNGGGVPSEILEKIFEPYFTTKSAKNGTGLGLYIAKTIIEKHQGGNIGVRNEEQGACFWIRMPIKL
jgi:PAS domain S-box-containing protein